jgi:GcrA cell cycle regulator
MQSNWAPAHSKALGEYFAMGMSHSAIADAINAKFNTSYTRNAVLGRATRMGLAGAVQPQDGTKSALITEKSLSITETSRIILIRERASTKPWRQPPTFVATEIAPLRCAEIVPRRLALVDLKRGDCRYPYGGDADGEAITFCGHPRQPGSSYCAAHFELSIGPGTASERSAGAVLLHIVKRLEALSEADASHPYAETFTI